jgi:hypothetical protein
MAAPYPAGTVARNWSQSGPTGTLVDLVGMQNSTALNMA